MSNYDLQEAAAAVSARCPEWSALIENAREQAYFQQLQAQLATRSQSVPIFPPADDVFRAFALTPLAATKVVILGQDPYHQPNQAHGLAFSVAQGVRPPPSLRNIYKAVQHDYPSFEIPQHGNLQGWAEQGVLLLNTVLTVEQGRAHAHAKLGWQHFTDAVMDKLNAHQQPLVFLLWGKHAQTQGRRIDAQRHLKLEAVHPSPLSAHRGFLTCGHFASANTYLVGNGQQPIDWQQLGSANATEQHQKQQRQQKLAF